MTTVPLRLARIERDRRVILDRNILLVKQWMAEADQHGDDMLVAYWQVTLDQLERFRADLEPA